MTRLSAPYIAAGGRLPNSRDRSSQLDSYVDDVCICFSLSDQLNSQTAFANVRFYNLRLIFHYACPNRHYACKQCTQTPHFIKSVGILLTSYLCQCFRANSYIFYLQVSPWPPPDLNFLCLAQSLFASIFLSILSHISECLERSDTHSRASVKQSSGYLSLRHLEKKKPCQIIM